MRPQQLKLFILQEKQWQKLLIWGRVLDQDPKITKISPKFRQICHPKFSLQFYRILKMSIPKFGILDQFLVLFSKLASFRISGFSGFFQNSFVVLWDFSEFLDIPMDALKFLKIPWDSLEMYIWALIFTFLQANYYWEIDGIFLHNSIC